MAGLRGVIVDIAPLRAFPDYRRLWGADLVASAAHELVAVAVPFQVYVLTGSSLAVGLVGAAELVPLLLGSLAAGAFVDAHDRRRLILVAQVGAAACAAGLGAPRGRPGRRRWWRSTRWPRPSRRSRASRRRFGTRASRS